MNQYDRINSNDGMIDRLWSKARQRPEALLLFAAGFALIMTKKSTRSSVRSAQHSLTDKMHDAQDYVSEVASEAVDKVTSLAEPVRDYANRVTNYVSETGESAFSQATDLVEQTRKRASTNLDHYMHAQPIALGMLSLAIGAAVGAALPATDVENRALGAQSDLLVRKAREAAGDQIEQLKAAAGQLGDQVSQTLKDQGDGGSKSNTKPTADARSSAGASSNTSSSS